MIIYKAKVWSECIEVKGYEVEKETDKTYKIKDSYSSRINKDYIGRCDTYSYGYGLTKEEAINAVRRRIESDIAKYERWIKESREKLEKPIKEV